MSDGDTPPTSRRALWDQRHAAHEAIESRAPEAVLIETAATMVPGRALDLATGDGRNAIWLARQGWQVTAVDFSSVALDRARAASAHAGVEVAWVLADLVEWRPEPEAFDLVTIVFLHLPPQEREPIYARAAAAVGPAGALLVIGHDTTNPSEGTGGPQDPEVLFSPDRIAAEAVGAGLTVERAERVVRDLGEGRRAIDAVIRAVRPTR
jgi:SAM-dependent methyltransferase